MTVDTLNVCDAKDNEDIAVEKLTDVGCKENEGFAEYELNVDNSDDNEGLALDKLTVEDVSVKGLSVTETEGKEAGDVVTVENVGCVVCLWQLPFLIETSSMAKSPLKEDPVIPSNVT